MKIVDGDPALLTNSEVLEVLTSRDSDKQAAILPSEVKLSKALEARGSSSKKTREDLQAFTVAITKEFNINKEEILQLINHAPPSILEAFLCLEKAISDKRLSEDDLDRVVEVVGEYLR